MNIPEQQIPEFGIKRDNEERRDGGCAVIFDPETKMFAVGKQDEGGAFRLFSGGVDPDEDIERGVLREVEEESGLHDFSHVELIAKAMSHFHNTLKNVNRLAMATCFLVILRSRDTLPVKLEAHETFSLAFASESEILENWAERNAGRDYDHWVYFFNIAISRLKELGYL